MDPQFWKGRKVFVTGHTGFKGSWLSLWLQRLSAHVVGYSLPAPTTPSLYEVADVTSGMTSIVGDVRDYPRLRESLEKHRPEIVFHMAAQSVVRLSYQDPIDTYSTNVMGTVNLLEAMRHLPGRTAIVNVTSDKSYENKEWIWGYRETDRLGGYDPYSNSKACSELVTQAFADSFFSVAAGKDHDKSIATARAGNVIGGGDWTHDQLVPDVVNAFHEGRPAVLRNPHATRPWQFVLDCLGGYMTLAEKLSLEGTRYAGPWNFGPHQDDTLAVGELVERLISKWPGKASWVQDAGSHPHEAGSLRLDTSKTIQQLGWKPRLVVAEALDWIVDWYARYFQGAKAKALCLEQIRRFEEKTPAR
ncbi:MAG TPA: CDP-glucose 4,6-dehydratase [Burkholderiales bacterium]|nr:CDP-glucose 4,6-dehydratase [Burkholderiales bacterium]